MDREQIKQVCRNLAKKDGLINISLISLCKNAKISTRRFKTIMGCTFSNLIEDIRSENLSIDNTEVLKVRAQPKLREKHLLDVAIEISIDIGYDNITRRMVADKTSVSESTINHYFGSISNLKNEVVKECVNREVLAVIAQALSNNHKEAKKASKSLKIKSGKLIGDY